MEIVWVHMPHIKVVKSRSPLAASTSYRKLDLLGEVNEVANEEFSHTKATCYETP